MPVRYQIRGSGAADIVTSVETGIRTGDLQAGVVLPPVRTLAADLGVAPATVAAAYRTLRQRGLVETAGRNGTRVRQRPPVLSRAAHRPELPPGTIDLSAGEPDRRLLPPLGAHLRRLAKSASAPLGYTETGPWPELVDLGRQRLERDGIPTGAAVTVTSGALDALERLLTAHLQPGDTVGIEDPGWANLIDLAAALGLRTAPMTIDDQGPTVDGLRAVIRAGARAIVVTSRAQNPTGAAVTNDRATQLRRLLAAAPEVLVIEDDHAGELAEVELAPLAGAGARWAFVRSVSKPYGPDLRVAVVAGDDESIARVEGRMRLGAGWVSTLLQRLVLELWQDPAVAAVVARARDEYSRRRESLLTALAARGVDARGRTGMNVWVPVPDEAEAVAALRDRGFAVAPGSLYRLASPPGIRLTVSPLTDAAGIESVADAVAAAVTASRVGRGVLR
ncbi:MAG TPA: aminotransferase class I/II-fold pyridoxal phosphate-dependent enzyme [Micromonosporaceae bacterium]|nr:aminotransferase class I/II-fold pyridoxal phosphate-dependent enzyme [Micromonosporaceae bacterium]